MLIAALATFAVATQAAPVDAARRAPVRSGLSWAEAESLTRKLETIDRRSRERRPARIETVVVTQGELNSYLNLTLAPEMPAGVTDVDVRLDSERVYTRAQVDLEKVRGQAPSASASGWGSLSLLAGRVPVELTARLLSRDGFGSVEVEDVRLASLPVPVSVVEQLVSSATRTAENPKGFDILAPFRLPYAVKRVRITPGRAFLEF